jgi:hypothetical protein
VACPPVAWLGWTFFPPGCGWGPGTNWSEGGGPGAAWSQPGSMMTQSAGYHSQPVVDYNIAFANGALSRGR